MLLSIVREREGVVGLQDAVEEQDVLGGITGASC